MVECTRVKLERELRKAALLTKDESKIATYAKLADRAATGEFDDYADTHVCPIIQLHNELIMAGLEKFACRVAGGEFDTAKEENGEWAASPSGQQTLGLLSSSMRRALFGDK